MTYRQALRDAISDGLILCVFLVFHCVAAGIVLGGGFLLHHFLIETGDPKLYDLVPWRYAIDTLDLAVVIILGLNVLKLAISPSQGKKE